MPLSILKLRLYAKVNGDADFIPTKGKSQASHWLFG